MSAPGSVAIFASSFAPNLGGVEELVARLAHELKDRDIACIVVTNRWPAELSASSVERGVAVHRFGFTFPGRHPRRLLRFAFDFPRVLAGCVRLLRRHRVELVHIQCVSTNALYGWLAARILRIPVVVTLQGELTMDAHQVFARSALHRAVLRRLLARADAVTACSRHTLSEAEEIMGVQTAARGRVIYNGVSTAEFESPAEAPSSDRPYALAIGRHVREKGFDVLLAAFARTAGEHDVDLVVAGDGPDHAALRDQAEQLGIDQRVQFPGRCDRARTAALFQGCEFFVLPSRHEPFGIVNLEAMASGAALIATRVGGVPEFVADGRNGLLVEPEEVDAMAEAISTLARDRGLRQRLAEAGRQTAKEFDWSAIAAQYIGLYQSIRSPRPLADTSR